MRVAILEDDVHVGQLMSFWLEKAGHAEQLFTTGEGFSKSSGRERCDLLILDRTLPDISVDIELAWVRSHVDWPVPVIFKTAKEQSRKVTAYKDMGAMEVIAKPFDPMALADMVRQVWAAAHG